MAKPLRSDDPTPKDVSFRDFGVLDTGGRSKGAAVTSIVINASLAALILILGMVVKNNPVMAKKLTELTLAPEPPKEPPPPPKLPPPPPPKLPPPPPVETAKITPPKPVELPPEIKPMPAPVPKVNLAPPAPKKVDPPPAPVQVNLGTPKAAAIANNDQHPSAVRMGNPEIKALNNTNAQPTNVNLGGGMHGMPASNTGSGPHAVNVSMGNGSPGGTNLNGHDRGPVPITGLSNGVPGGTGRGASGPVAVQIAQSQPTNTFSHPPVTPVATLSSPPKVTFKPAPVYTEEAKAIHLEGSVTVRIRVGANGAVEVLGVVHGLGHGLDQSAEHCAQGIRFQPAKDSSGNPMEWEGTVNISFQLS